MSMNAASLEDLIMSKLSTALRTTFDNVVVGYDVSQVPRDDGTLSYEVEERRGVITMTREQLEKMRPMARAIAQAVVEHLTSHAQANDTAAGQSWRIV
jgi:hypothetical protein